MWNSSDVNKIRKGRKYVKNSLKKSINNVIKSIKKEYKSPFIYRWKYKNSKYGIKYGVFIWQNGRYRWCWINTINTNSATLAVLLNFINKNYTRKLWVDDFFDEPVGSCEYFDKCIKEHPELFLPHNETFKEMFFAAQLSWNKSIISQIGTQHTMSKKYGITFEIGIERGNQDDMIYGIDSVLEYSGSTKDTVQLKFSHNGLLEFDGEYYWWIYIDYEDSYRELKKIIIDDDTYVYYFNNSKSQNLCGYDIHPSKGKRFKIHKSLLIDIMEHTESLKITSLLQEINQICFKKHIVFYIDTDDSGKNSIERIIENKADTVKFILNRAEDEDLLQIVTDFYEKFKTTL